MRVWRLASLAPRSASSDEGPLVGRRSELAQLRAAVEGCREAGTGSVVHLRGEAGIGKSRLLQELRRHAERAGFACHLGLVLDFGAGKGRGPVASIARSLLDIPAGTGEEGRRAAAERAVAAGSVTPDRRVFLYDLL